MVDLVYQFLPHSKASIFVDGPNFYVGSVHFIRNNNLDNSPTDILFGIVNYYSEHHKIEGMEYFESLAPMKDPRRYAGQSRYLEQVRKYGFLVHSTLPAEFINPYTGSIEYKEKGVDTGLSARMTRLAAEGKYETAIVIGGDGDLYEPIMEVIDIGKNVEHTYYTEDLSHRFENILHEKYCFTTIRSILSDSIFVTY